MSSTAAITSGKSLDRIAAHAVFKTKLCDIMEAFWAGRMPDNAQIDEFLLRLDHPTLDISKLSHDGRELALHFREMIETTRLVFKQKNAGELLQKTIWHMSDPNFSKVPVETSPASPIRQEAAQKEDQKSETTPDTFRIFRTIFIVIFTTDIRNILADVSIANRYGSARGITKLGEKTRPAPRQSTVANPGGDVEPRFGPDPADKEWRDQYFHRVQKFILENQMSEDCRTAFTWLWDLSSNYLLYDIGAPTTPVGQASQGPANPFLHRAAIEYRNISERIANGRSLGDIENSAHTLHEDAMGDEELWQWFGDADDLINKAILEPGAVLSPAFRAQRDQLYERSHRLFEGKYKSHKDRLFDDLSAWFGEVADDPLMDRLSTNWKRLRQVLLFDNDGNLAFKPRLWNDIREVILPILVDNVGFIPIPRIEYTNDDFDLVLENLTLQGQNLFPSVIAFEERKVGQFLPDDTTPDIANHTFTFSLSQSQVNMPDVGFYFNKKRGFPKFKVSGLANGHLGKKGLTGTVHLEAKKNDRWSVFRVKHVEVKLDSLNFSVRDTKHDLLYNVLKPLATGLVKKQVAKAITDMITTGCEFVNKVLVHFRDRVAEAPLPDEQSREDALKQIFEHKQAEATLKNANGTSKFRIGFRRHSGLNPIQLGKPKAAVDRSEGWRSNAFTMGNTVPAAPVRKSSTFNSSRSWPWSSPRTGHSSNTS